MNIPYHVALERGLAELIQQFQDAPDLFLREADLHAAAYAALEREPLLRARYATRDGRRTGLLHREYPPLLTYEKDEGGRMKDEKKPSAISRQPLPSPEIGRRAGDEGPSSFILHPYDLVLLNPSFVRAHDLETVTNADPQRAAPLRALPSEARPKPLLAALNLTLIDIEEGLKPTSTPIGVLAELEAETLALARSEADAERAYLGVFCRHWDPEGPARAILQALERWADEYPRLSIVFLQAYRDDLGRVAGGRYFNLWSHMAPLMPLGSCQ